MLCSLSASCSCSSGCGGDQIAVIGALLSASLRRTTLPLVAAIVLTRMWTWAPARRPGRVLLPPTCTCTLLHNLVRCACGSLAQHLNALLISTSCCSVGLAVLLDAWRWACRQDSGAAGGAEAAAGGTVTREALQNRYVYRCVQTPFSDFKSDSLSVCLWLADMLASNVINTQGCLKECDDGHSCRLRHGLSSAWPAAGCCYCCRALQRML